MAYPARQFFSIEAFLDHDDTNETRSEYVGGAVYAMTGGRISHNRVAVLLARALGSSADIHGCDIFVSDARLRIGDLIVTTRTSWSVATRRTHPTAIERLPV